MKRDPSPLPPALDLDDYSERMIDEDEWAEPVESEGVRDESVTVANEEVEEVKEEKMTVDV